ncbi:hypothetical protein JB92DRAFT_2859402 [Gautieria morchelliformis]|nr:hypothetical protein JB92DRAFT_2859402 [Gautieria morchelliformis]
MKSLQTIILVAVAIMTAQTSARTLDQRGLEAFAARQIVCDIACLSPQIFCSPLLQIQTINTAWRNVIDPLIRCLPGPLESPSSINVIA